MVLTCKIQSSQELHFVSDRCDRIAYRKRLIYLGAVALSNEMVSLGDTAISLHILQPPLGGGVLEFSILGGDVLDEVRFGIWKEN